MVGLLVALLLVGSSLLWRSISSELKLRKEARLAVTSIAEKPSDRDKEATPIKPALPLTLPELRPIIRAVRYGRSGSLQAQGLETVHEGEPAYEVSIPDVKLGTSVVSFQGRIPMMHGRSSADWRVLITHDHGGVSTGNVLRDEMRRQGIGEIAVPILYQDGKGLHYVSHCRIELDASVQSGLAVHTDGQELVEKEAAQTPLNAPELILEYSHSEQVTYSEAPPNPYKPILVKNVTPNKNAYNVRICALTTADGTARFDPDIVTCIRGGDETEFNARVEGGPPFMRNQLLHLLAKSYKEGVPGYDISRDLFGEKPFTVTIEYTDSSSQCRYAADCELLYRAWKHVIRPGKHRIRKIS